MATFEERKAEAEEWLRYDKECNVRVDFATKNYKRKYPHIAFPSSILDEFIKTSETVRDVAKRILAATSTAETDAAYEAMCANGKDLEFWRVSVVNFAYMD